jgi:PTH1 family peptidyl-tRNA hydrolase
MWLVVGLGNPGPRYQRNRHNVGFRVVERVAERCGWGSFRGGKLGGDVASGALDGERVVLLKPMEFMNHSGFAVQRAAQFHGVEPDRILVVHDEIDFEFGRLKVKSGGGHGGHNGLRSIAQQLGSGAFARVRCGVGRPPGMTGPVPGSDDRRVSAHVLGDFAAEQAAGVEDLIDRAARAVELVVTRGAGAAMNEVNAQPGGKPGERADD